MSKTRDVKIRILVLAVLVVGTAGWALGQSTMSALERGFKDPPDSAKPRAWWHWLNGNVTKEGITADLEWMKRVGIAGMQMFDGNVGTPQFVDKRLVWMTPEWKDAWLDYKPFRADTPLLESGLLGPVTLSSVGRK